jgi:hypothetical protein
MRMDMWNWLLDCYNEGSITLDDLKVVMKDDLGARMLWEDWTDDPEDFIEDVRKEVLRFIEYIEDRKAKGKL